jgi:hypothetical protein
MSEWRCSFTIRPFYDLGKSPSADWKRGWVSHRAGLDAGKGKDKGKGEGKVPVL